MRVGITDLHHFRMTPDGTVYPHSVFDYKFYQRYLEVFEEVVVFARLERIPPVDPATMPAKSSGPGVKFFALPEYLGAWQYAKVYPKIRRKAKEFLAGADAVVLRVPNYLSTLVWHQLRREKRPYAAEVVGDPWGSAAPGRFQSMLRPVLRHMWTRDMQRICHYSAATAYVTETALQQQYPPGGWSTHYASIELPREAIIDEAALAKRLEGIDAKARSGGPWRICFVGTLFHLCKAPDVLIDAVGECTKQGMKLELVVCGEGQMQPQLAAQAQSLGIGEQVRFMGQLPPGWPVYGQLDLADMYVLPSRSEGLPRSVVEAMARGLPCLGSSVGGIPELLDDRQLVAPGDGQQLAARISKMLKDPEGMKAAVKRNVAKATEFRSDVLQERRRVLYRKLRAMTEEWQRQQRR